MTPSRPSAQTWALLAAAIVTEVAATLSLRAALDHPAWFVVVVGGYLGAFVLLGRVLGDGMQVGVAYGVWAASGVALTAALAAVLFADPFTVPMILGVALVITGVLLVELGSHAGGRVPAEVDVEMSS